MKVARHFSGGKAGSWNSVPLGTTEDLSQAHPLLANLPDETQPTAYISSVHITLRVSSLSLR
jgi:hypothetical protein